MSLGRFTPDVRFTNRVTGTGEHDGRFRQINYDLCRAIDMISLGIVLDRMVEEGLLNKHLAEIYHDQAGGLLALLRTENNRAHNV